MIDGVMPLLARLVLSLTLVLGVATAVVAQTIEYTLSFPAPRERWMAVEVRFPATPGEPLDVRMSRSSPGRYATHEFAKNVYALTASSPDGSPLVIQPQRPDVWRVVPTATSVVIRYRLFGDRVDGTYAAIDETHAHLNAPAVYLWAPALQEAPARVRLVRPEGSNWEVATQLFPTDDPLVFTAPNLQYLMDSPVEFSAHARREFTVASPERSGTARIRLAVHHLGSDAEVETLTRDVERIVREQQAVFGELPVFDTGTYTFLLDYLPWAAGDGMEHRNSTVCTAAVGLAGAGTALLDTISHEFFHAWNVERIRPASLEPFDFSQANMSGELWFAEGFTSYYGQLTMRRAGLADEGETLGSFGASINALHLSPGVALRSAVEMSQLAPFVDAAVYIDRVNWENTYLSYYTHGASLGLGLDLMLRDRSDGRVSLDDYMRAVWEEHGRVPGPSPGHVGRPYTLADLRRILGDVSGDTTFAAAFFDRHVEGHEPIDFTPLLQRAGLELHPITGPTLGLVRLDARAGRAVVVNNIVSTAPVHGAGLNRDDEVVSLGGAAIRSQADWDQAVRRAGTGASLDLVFRSRGRERRTSVVTEDDPRVLVLPAERTGGTATAAQLAFRQAWLGSRVR
jgi:predicted metalloprotease with PDZ domain